ARIHIQQTHSFALTASHGERIDPYTRPYPKKPTDHTNSQTQSNQQEFKRQIDNRQQQRTGLKRQVSEHQNHRQPALPEPNKPTVQKPQQ
ncbi:hypothetical protein RA274_27945, partial [Pseudomonas syringae pv. tagetis]|uniref:hypothetical protein n=1 Tax=Pseudomonas syringae group genomosp. 7 TaxID=251699 RepID=UPI0037702F46